MRSFARRGAGVWSLAPALLGVLLLGTLATGLWWATVGRDAALAPGAEGRLREQARSVVVTSLTGYRRRFRLGSARELLLATQVGGEALSAGHGFPLCLVAPGRAATTG